MTTHLYESVDFDYIDRTANEISCLAYTQGFEVVSVTTRDDWANPGHLIITVRMKREDLDLSHEYMFRSNEGYVSNNSTTTPRSKVRNRYRALVKKMERRLNRTMPDAEGLYRRPSFDD